MAPPHGRWPSHERAAVRAGRLRDVVAAVGFGTHDRSRVPRRPRRRLRIAAVLALLAAGGCAGRPRLPQATGDAFLEALAPESCVAIVSGDDGGSDSLRRAAERSLRYLERLPGEARFALLDRTVTAADLRRSTEALLGALRLQPADWAQGVCHRLILYRVRLSRPVLITGYYQPVLPARRTETGRFRYSLYGPPPDLVQAQLGRFCPACDGTTAVGRIEDGRLVPYYSRAEIDAGVLAGRAPVLAWLDDPIEAFFLHIQGSGILRFEDGTRRHVSYAASNGRPYRSIGSLLVEERKMTAEQATMPALKDYLRRNPEERERLLHANERYIFFRVVPAGPVGSLGVPLTAGRSIALDPRVYPPAALTFVRMNPDVPDAIPPPASRVAFAQDTGAAIIGPGRVDLFIGTGDGAGRIAGTLRARGELYVLLAK